MKPGKDERGYLIVEAAVVYPLLIVIFAFFLYVLLLAAQRAQVVSAAEETMTYIKYLCAGNYDINEQNYDIEDGMELPVPEGSSDLYDVYETIFDSPSGRAKKLAANGSGAAKKIFDHYLKYPLLNNTEDINVGLDVHNYVIFTEIELNVSYKMRRFLNFSFIGAQAFNEPTFTVSMKGAVSDNVSTMRTMQYIDFVVVEFDIDDKIGELKGNIKNAISDKFQKAKVWFQ